MITDVLYKKFKRNCTDHSLSYAVRKSVLYLIKALYEQQTYRIYRIDLRAYTANSEARSEFAYKLIGVDDVGLIKQIKSMEEWLSEELSLKLHAGAICLVALDDEVVAGFNLVSFGKVYMPLVKVYRDFGKTSAWSEQITVNNNYRGKGLGAELRYGVFEELKKLGIQKFYGGTLSDNEPNLKLTRKVGFKEIADIHYSKRLGSSSWSCRRVGCQR